MVNYRGRGRGGRITQVKVTLDEDAGEGFLALEQRLLGGVFSDGFRSDAMRLVLRHFVESPPDGIWMKKRWRKPLGEGWPDATPSEETASEDLPL